MIRCHPGLPAQTPGSKCLDPLGTREVVVQLPARSEVRDVLDLGTAVGTSGNQPWLEPRRNEDLEVIRAPRVLHDLEIDTDLRRPVGAGGYHREIRRRRRRDPPARSRHA